MKREASKIKVLYVEDDPTIAYLTRDNLELRGYEVSHVTDGLMGLEAFRREHFDVCVVDIMLPRLDGYSLAKEIRLLDPHVPILFLSAKSMVEDRIHGFNLGADDYITKPFSMDELILRIEVFLRRTNSAVEKEKESEQLGRYVLDKPNQQLLIGDEKIDLTLREMELLEYLIQNKNRVVKRHEVLNSIWGDDDYFLGRSLDVFISRLRKILKEDERIKIENVHGVGFRFKIPDKN